MRVTKFLSATAVVGLISAMPAHAQDVQDEDAVDDNIIIVTASKRETTLQELPLSVSVTSAETIEQAQIRDLLDLQTVAPSLRISQNQGSANATLIIRGFGNGSQNIGIEPSVGVFIDGVFRSRSAAQIGDLANVARVEVLRGPQSTLFGKNASAGVISLVTREPQFEFGGSIEASYGNYDAVVLKGDITGPISENLAFSLDGAYNRRDGYNEIVNLGEDSNNRNRWNVRGQLLWEPTDDLKIRAIADYSTLDEDCCIAVNVLSGPTTPAIFAVGGAVATDPFNFETFANRVPENQIDNYGGSIQVDYTAGPLSFTSITAYRKLESDNIQDVDFSSADVVDSFANQEIDSFTQEVRITSDFDGPINFLLGGFYFNEDAEQLGGLTIGPDARPFFSLLAGAPLGFDVFSTIEGPLGLTPNSIFSPGLFTSENFSFSNESYSIFGTVDFEVTDGLTLTGGFNYTDDSKDFVQSGTAFDSLANINLVDAVIVGQLVPFLGANAADPASIAAFAADPATAPVFNAIAAAATGPANPFLGLAAFQFQPPFLSIPNVVEDGQTSDSDFSYTLLATYEASDNLNVYLKYATGFKASSINLSRDSRPTTADFTPGPGGSTILAPSSPILDAGLAVPNLSTGTRFAGPEDAETYEVGLKGKFDRFGFNLAIFDQTLRGFQSNAFTGTGFALTNAGESSVTGFEFDATVSPADPLLFTFAMTFLDTEFDSFPGSSVGDLTGESIGGVSSYSLAASATYTHEFNSGAELIGRIDYSHESNTPINNGLPTFNTALGNTQIFNREVNLVNGSLTMRLNNGLQLSVWGRNILNQTHLTTVFDGVAQAGTVSGYTNQPRTYGASAKFKF